jgi:cystathionine beta-lyase/cystathionine gamma-synthase
MLGTGAAPQDSRMRQICASSQAIAEFLSGHPAVRRVHYPGLVDHPDHLLAVKQMPEGFGGVISVEIDGDADAAWRTAPS